MAEEAALSYVEKHKITSVVESAVNEVVKLAPPSPWAPLAHKLSSLVGQAKPEVVFVLGGPGVGKGTQCARIVDRFGFIHLSAGDLLREERKRGGPTAELIDGYIKSGKIVPVEITIGLLKTEIFRHAAKGRNYFLIDGFPRSFDNLEGWDRTMQDAVVLRFCLFFECPDEEVLVQRVMQRAQSSGRDDDNIETIRLRLKTFYESTQPVVEALNKRGLVHNIRGDAPIEEVWQRVQSLFYRFFDDESTVLLVKPDAAVSHYDEIITKIFDLGFTVMEKRTILLTQRMAIRVFPKLREGKEKKAAFEFLNSGPSIALALRRSKAVSTLLRQVGPENPEEAKKSAPKSFRALFGTSLLQNAVHASLTPEDANREMEVLFPSSFFPSNIVPRRLIIAGAPAAGKGTQCERIKQRYGVRHISTGDLLRAAAKAGTELGRRAAEFMAAGKLVPDEVVIGLVKAELELKESKERGWMLDGFPRTPSQAEALTELGIQPDSFIMINVPDEILVERVVGRRSDPVTGKIYHLKFSPPPEDPAIRERLTHREDDTEAAVKTRLYHFHAHTNAVALYYHDVFVSVNGNQSPEAVFSEISHLLG